MLNRLCRGRRSPSSMFAIMPLMVQNNFVSTVAEIKEAVTRLPERQKIQIARWMQTQISDRLSDDEMMAIAAEGARALDRREARHAKRKTR
jgi:hypothetical protein